VLHYVVRTQESVILDDAAVQNRFSSDEYLRHRRVRSLLCLPLVKQTKLIGVLYLENNLASGAFTPARITMLKLLSSQAAISLENARLYADLVQESRDRTKAEEALRSTQADLARVARLTTMGELVASIAHEINQPLAAVVTSGTACLRWLDRAEPDIEAARKSVLRIVRDAGRAGEVIHGLRSLAKKSGPQLMRLDLNDAIQEVLALTRSELQARGVALQTTLSSADRPVVGDRVQLQQVLLNLILNGLEAMAVVTDRPKVLAISAEPVEPGGVLVAVEDTGPGLDPATADRIFDPFFTTKPDGMGMGLSICRSIIDAHGGRFWAAPRKPWGTVFRFTVPREFSAA
jgi:C4-dicarboxylate-specific signal transduction histidine kinase